jgi:heat shock protein HslJ
MAMNIKKQANVFFVVVMVCGFLLGCQPKSNDLIGSNWELVTINGNDLIPNTTITLEFSEEYLGGQMECNGYGGTPDTGGYQIGKNGLFSLGDLLAVTVQLCSEPEGIMEQEKAYIEALMSAVRYQVSDDRLEFENENGQTVLFFVK